jgi:hypothetical protein
MFLLLFIMIWQIYALNFHSICKLKKYLVFFIFSPTNIFHSSFFILHSSFFILHSIWASRFAGFARSRRAIRSITRHASRVGWFRYYPSRCKRIKYRKIYEPQRGDIFIETQGNNPH